MKIEGLKQEHIGTLVQMEKLCFGPTAWTEESFAGELCNEASLCLVALRETEPIGCVAANLSADTAFISKVMVAPAARRKGVAKALLQALCAQAQQRGAVEVTLEVRASNEAAIALYNSFDFQTIGKRRNFYRFPKEDAVIMTKTL